jgi:hypothetical protein
MHVGYEEARSALEASRGDVVAALARLEQTHPPRSDLLTVGGEIMDEVQRLLDRGVVRKIRVKLGRRTLKEIPVSLTALGALTVGLVAVLISLFAVELERD